MAYKPGSVRPYGVDDYSSRPRVAARLKQPTRVCSVRKTPADVAIGAPRLFGLAPGEVCPAIAVTSNAVGFYPTVSPLPFNAPGIGYCRTLRAASRADGSCGLTAQSAATAKPGGLFSVALSLGLPPVGVTHHRFLWSPDFPRGMCRAIEAFPSLAP
jgi:hypothetical protein